MRDFSHPSGASILPPAIYPALKCWAIIARSLWDRLTCDELTCPTVQRSFSAKRLTFDELPAPRPISLLEPPPHL